jgi:hypothetical protein
MTPRPGEFHGRGLATTNPMACAGFNAGARSPWKPVMSLQLRDHLHWCNCGGRAVFLDMPGDRYFCLPHAPNDAFLRAAARTMRPGDEERLQLLVTRGMLIEGGEGGFIQPPPLIESPTHDFFEGTAHRAGLLPILRALAAELGASWALRTRPFHAVVEAARSCGRGKRSKGSGPGRAVREIVAAATAMSYINPSHDRCLVRALAVHALCRSSGSRPRLVFGVIAHPFTAHCWVQLGNAVLVGGYEQARLYTPILVLE